MKQCLIYDNSLRFSRTTYGFLALAAFLTHNMWLVLITAIIMTIGLITTDKYNFFLRFHQQVLRRLLKDTSKPLSRDVWELRFACGLGTVFLLIGFCLVYFGKFVNLGWILVLILSLVMLLSGLAGICMATLFYAGFRKFLGKKENKMEFEKKISPTKLGNPNYVNPNCWVAVAINGPPYERCRYCIKSYKQCPIFRYIIISLGLVSLSLVGTFFIERELWGSFFKIILFSDFIFVIVYGYFYNKVTVEVIKAEYEAKKILEIKIEQRTKELREAYQKIEKVYKIEKESRQLAENAKKELQKLDEAKTQFIMATQHHLRTPLTSMKGYLDLIFGGTYGKVSAKLKDPIFKFQVSTNRLIRIVNEFLDITQFQLGKRVISLQPNVSIEPIFKEIIEELQFEAKARNIYLKFQKPEKIPEIKADPEKLKMALFNLIDNGIKYTHKGGVAINVKSLDGKLQIIVKDTGVGIPKEEVKTLFVRLFERGREAKEIHGTGRGIGLFIASHIIKAHKGKIWAESEGKGKGSTFYVELPITR